MLGFDHKKGLCAYDDDFSRFFELCEKIAHNGFFRHGGFLFKYNMLCMHKSYLHESLIREACEGGLIGHFGVDMTLCILHEHFFWQKMKHDVNKYCGKYIICHKAKFKV